MLRVKRRFIKGFVSIVVSLLIVFFVSYPYFGLEEDKKFLLMCSFVVFIQSVFYFLTSSKYDIGVTFYTITWILIKGEKIRRKFIVEIFRKLLKRKSRY